MSDISNNNVIDILREIGNRLTEETTIILCGGAASILANELQYRTRDLDLLFTDPKLIFDSSE